MGSDIKLVQKNEYGRVRNYPVCEVGKSIMSMTGRKYFNEKDLSILQGLNFNIVWISEGEVTKEEGNWRLL